MGHGAWSMGHGAWVMGHGAWRLEEAYWYQAILIPIVKNHFYSRYIPSKP